MEKVEVHSKDFLIRWIEVPSGSEIRWRVHPLKKSINFGVYRQVGKVESSSGALQESSSSVPMEDRLVKNGFEPFVPLEKLAAGETHDRSFTVPAEKGGMFAFVFDNTFSKSTAKTVEFSLESTERPSHHLDPSAALNGSHGSQGSANGTAQSPGAAAAAAAFAASSAQPAPTANRDASNAASAAMSEHLNRSPSLPASSAYSAANISSTSLVSNDASRSKSLLSSPSQQAPHRRASMSRQEPTVPTLSDDGRYLTGVMLKKRRKKMQGYAKRYFSLDTRLGQLHYYLNERTPYLRGVMPIRICDVNANSDTREITLNSGMERWSLKALTTVDFETWLSAMSGSSAPTLGHVLSRQQSLMQPPSQRVSGQYQRGHSRAPSFAVTPTKMAEVEEDDSKSEYHSISDKDASQGVDPAALAQWSKKLAHAAEEYSRSGPLLKSARLFLSQIEEVLGDADSILAQHGYPATGYSVGNKNRVKASRSKSVSISAPTDASHTSRSVRLLSNGGLGAAAGAALGMAAGLATGTIGGIAAIAAAGAALGASASVARVTDGGEHEAESLYDDDDYYYDDSDDGLSEYSSDEDEDDTSSSNSSDDEQVPVAPSGDYPLSDALDAYGNDIPSPKAVPAETTAEKVISTDAVGKANSSDDRSVTPTAQEGAFASVGAGSAAESSGVVGSSVGTETVPVAEGSLAPLPHAAVHRRTDVPSCTHSPPSLISMIRKSAGKDLTSITAPVTSNEPITLLQRMSEILEYSELLDKASSAGPGAQRSLYVAAFAISQVAAVRCKERVLRKPFNPLLGETFELVREDKGFRFVSEKVSHRPPVLAAQAESSNWTLQWTSRPHQKIWGKSAEITDTGPVRIVFRDGEYVDFMVPDCFLRNLIAGEKYVEPVGTVTIEPSESPAATIEFKTGGMFSGRSEEVKVTIGGDVACQGKWTESLVSPDGKTIWRAGDLVANPAKHYGWPKFTASLNQITELEKGQLPPNDSRLRPDQREYENVNVDAAEELKLALEQKQRDRRKTYEDSGKTWEPVFFQKSPDEHGYFTLKPDGGNYWVQRESGTFNAPQLFET